ncbi:MAG: SH3 domain-containing protein [Planctomycetota bacterium]|jgi:SH3-like domain-containing protein
MKSHKQPAAWICLVMVFFITGSVWSQTEKKASGPTTKPSASVHKAATVKPTTRTFPLQGSVKGNNVYVRSGFNQNYYPVTKLNRGHKVTVVAEEFGWYKIIPPNGVHSLIEKIYVDRIGTGKNTGTLNRQTWVFAGSNLNDQRYAKQARLPKGARVTILGDSSDGKYLKLKPPDGAHLWISGDWVDLIKPSAESFGPKPTIVKPGKSKREGIKSKTDSPKGKASSEDYQSLIDTIEKKISAEAVKPPSNRVLEPIIKQLQPIAEQKDDDLARLYAQARLKQLQEHLELVTALRVMRELTNNAVTGADAKARKRALIKAKKAVPPDRVVVRGMIKPSGIYDGKGNRPLRWRVVDPSNQKTLAYIELSEASKINPVDYYGKRVGIRASARRINPSTIPPLPIYTVEKIVIEGGIKPKRPAKKTSMASPASPKVAAPSSKPAAETAKDENTAKEK